MTAQRYMLFAMDRKYSMQRYLWCDDFETENQIEKCFVLEGIRYFSYQSE